MFTAPAETPALSADALRFVRCEKSLERAIAQHAMTLAQLPKREQHAAETGNSATAEMARETVAAWAQRVVELGGTVEAKAEVKPAKRGRCSHYAMIREFMAAAREMGLDTEAKDRCRGAVGMLLGKRIESRSDLSAAEWGFCTNALRMNRLFW